MVDELRFTRPLKNEGIFQPVSADNHYWIVIIVEIFECKVLTMVAGMYVGIVSK